MSTRANIIVKDGYSKLFFYRHSDGYPKGTMPTLTKLLDWVKDGKLRDNVGQFSGWLILIGALEYGNVPNVPVSTPAGYAHVEDIEDPKDWKVGAYEPTNGIHGDIEYLYIVDLQKKTIKTVRSDFNSYA